MNRENIAKNIKYLRKKYKLSLKELAEALDVGKSTICEYENCKREPQIIVLERIADYFDFDLDRIDSENIEDFLINYNLSIDDTIRIFIQSIPLLYVNNKDDIYFKNAYKQHKKIFDIVDEANIDFITIKHIKTNYEDSWNKFKCVESLVNLISIILLEYSLIEPKDYNVNEKIYENTILSTKTIRELTKNYINNKDMYNIKNEYYLREKDRVKELIQLLKINNQNDAADYFMGLRLLYGFTEYAFADQDIFQENQKAATFYLLSLYTDFDNPFAKKYFDYIEQMEES